MRTLVFLIGLSIRLPVLAQEGASPAEVTLFRLGEPASRRARSPSIDLGCCHARAAHAHAQRMSREQAEREYQYPGEPDVPARAAQAGGHFSRTSENRPRGVYDLSSGAADALEAELLFAPVQQRP
jgi:hypothetical protein